MSQDEYIDTPVAGSNPTTQKAMGRVAARGSALIVLSQIVTKIGGLLSLWVMGFKLSEEQFGLWALALPVVYIVDCVRDLGANKVLVQRGSEYEQIASPVFRLGLAFNTFGTLLLLALAPVTAHVYHDPVIGWLIAVAAFSIPLQTPATILRSKLSIDLKFKQLSYLQIGSQSIKNLSMIVLALLGFGPYSFAIPMILVALFDVTSLRLVAGAMPPRHPESHKHYRSLLHAIKWIAFGAVAMAIINQGDRLVMGLFKDKQLLGIYFFGFQLVMSGLQIFSVGVMNVFMPTLTKLTGDPARMARGFQRLVRTSMVLLAPACVVATIAYRPAIETLWQGRWDVAIPITQIMSLSMCLFILRPVSLSLIEAMGRWRLRSGLMCLNTVTVLAAAAIASKYGGLLAITIAMACQRAAIGLFQCFVANHVIKAPAVTLAESIATPLLVAGLLGVGSYFLFIDAIPIHSSLGQAGASIALFAVLYLGVLYLFMHERFKEVIAMVGHMMPRKLKA